MTQTKNQKIFIAGHRGTVGSVIIRRLDELGAGDIVTATRAELDLTSQSQLIICVEEKL